MTDKRLLELAADARSRIQHEQRTGSVRDAWSADTVAAVNAVTAHLIDVGVARELAELAVSRWVVTGRPIVECIDDERERIARAPDPTVPTRPRRSH